MNSPKPVIVHLIKSLGVGGCEKALLRTLPLLHKYHHVIITMHSPGLLASEFAKQGIEVVSLHSLFSLHKQVSTFQAKIVFTYMFHADFLGRIWSLFMQCPIIPYLRTTYNFPRYLPARIFEHLTSFIVRAYLANSQAVKDFYVTHLKVNPQKITVIPNGIKVQTPTFQAHSGINILCVANFHPNKGHEYLIKAFGQLSHPKINLWLAGIGETKSNMEALAGLQTNSSHIKFLGLSRNIDSLLASSDIFVLPTRFEGLSNALLEAMVAKVPIVASDIPENQNLIQSGINGILIPTKNVTSLAQALTRLITNAKLRRKIGQAGFQTARERFDIRLTISRWDAYIQKILSL